MRDNIKQSIRRYADHHVPTGSFLKAVFSNDLFEALGRADEENQRDITEICSYIYNEVPASCWGSRDAYEHWIKDKPDTEKTEGK